MRTSSCVYWAFEMAFVGHYTLFTCSPVCSCAFPGVLVCCRALSLHLNQPLSEVISNCIQPCVFDMAPNWTLLYICQSRTFSMLYPQIDLIWMLAIAKNWHFNALFFGKSNNRHLNAILFLS